MEKINGNKQNIKNNMEYRQYLMKNADSIVRYNQHAANINCGNSMVTPDLDANLSLRDPIYHFHERNPLRESYLSNKSLLANMCAPKF